jgi:hypothetical protein
MQEELYGEDKQSENQRRNNNMSNEKNESFVSPCELVEKEVTVAVTASVDSHHPENYYG